MFLPFSTYVKEETVTELIRFSLSRGDEQRKGGEVGLRKVRKYWLRDLQKGNHRKIKNICVPVTTYVEEEKVT